MGGTPARARTRPGINQRHPTPPVSKETHILPISVGSPPAKAPALRLRARRRLPIPRDPGTVTARETAATVGWAPAPRAPGRRAHTAVCLLPRLWWAAFREPVLLEPTFSFFFFSVFLIVPESCHDSWIPRASPHPHARLPCGCAPAARLRSPPGTCPVEGGAGWPPALRGDRADSPIGDRVGRPPRGSPGAAAHGQGEGCEKAGGPRANS